MRQRVRGLEAGVLLAVLVSACARTPIPAAPAAPTVAQRLAALDVLVREGCLDCLIAAYGQYDALRTLPGGAEEGTAGAIRSAALIAVRERELGMADDGFLEKARMLLAADAGQPAWVATALSVIDALPTGGAPTGAVSSDAGLERSRALRTNLGSWSNVLRDRAPVDELASYVWLALACTAGDARTLTLDAIVEPTSTFSGAPLIAFRRATCRNVSAEALQAILTHDPRFVEVEFLLGRRDVALLVAGQDKLEDAERAFGAAFAWHPAWPALTQAIANLAMTLEEFDRAVTFYDRTLSIEPHFADALLGKARALTYVGRSLDAIATVDQLMAERWFLGDAHFWRALNLYELERYDEAWTDIEAAAKLLVNGEVPKLAGRIAYSRHQIDVSRAKFEESHERKPDDCEAGYYLGVVLAELREWPRTATVLVDTAACLAEAERSYQADIAKIAASSEPPARRESKIARRQQYIANGRRQMATAFFDTAIAYYNLSRRDEARTFAEKVVDDEQFGVRARELLSRLGK
jgi:tetratricopeptide (TPR) repeat protein